MARLAVPQTLAHWNALGREYLPGHLGMVFLSVEPDEVRAEKTGKAIAHFRCTQMILYPRSREK